MREYGRNAAGLAGRFGSPGARVKIFDNNLVYAIVSGKDADRGSGELSVALVLTRAHGYLVPMHSRRSLTGPRIMGDHVEEINAVNVMPGATIWHGGHQDGEDWIGGRWVSAIGTLRDASTVEIDFVSDGGGGTR